MRDLRKYLIWLALLSFSAQLGAQPLSLQEALKEAASQNPTLQAAYAQVRSAEADVHQAYLLQNPELEARVLWPRGPGQPLQEYSISYNIIDLFQRGARVVISKSRRDATLMDTLRRAVEIEAEIKTAYYSVQGHSQALREQKVLLDIAKVNSDLAERQREAGNIPAIELAEKKAALLQARTMYYNRELALFESRQELARLLGRAPEVAQIQVSQGPPDLPVEEDKSAAVMVAEALTQRRDLQSLALEKEALQTDRGQQTLLIFDETHLGYAYEREVDGEVLHGAALTMPLPIFDQRQAQKQRLDAQIERQDALQRELTQQVTSEVNLLLVRMANARLRVEQLEELVPLRQEILDLSRQQYNAMLIGTYQLLDLRGQGSVTLLTLADAKADFWRAHAELERALGRTILEDKLPLEMEKTR